MAKSLGLLESTVFLVMHAFDAPAQTMMLLSGSTMNVLRDGVEKIRRITA
jgi:hypothetical protein